MSRSYSDERKDIAWRAFLAGFDWSGEGCNGEYVRSCHNVPEPGHVHHDSFLTTLREEFEKWWVEER
jgi:hypothetical protein